MHASGKEDRTGRKVGHVTVSADTPNELAQRVRALRELMGES